MANENITQKIYIKKADLYTHDGTKYDIRDLIEYLKLYTTINQWYKTLSLTLSETFDLITNYGLLGGEKFELVLQDTDGNIWMDTFFIYKIEPDESDIYKHKKARIINLKLATKDFLTNMTITVSKRIKGTSSYIFSYVMNTIMGTDRKLKIECEDNNPKDIIVNFWKPMDIIEFLTALTYDKYYDYIVFENLQKELRFVPISKLSEQSPKSELFLQQKDMSKILSNFQLIRGRILKYNEVDDLLAYKGFGNKVFYPHLYGNWMDITTATPKGVEPDMTFLGNYSVYPDKFSGVNEDRKVAFYDKTASAKKPIIHNYWKNFFHFVGITRASLKRDVGEVIKFKYPVWYPELSVNKYFDGNWLLRDQIIEIKRGFDAISTIVLVKNALFNQNRNSSPVNGNKNP